METENTNQCIQPIDLMGSMAPVFCVKTKRTEKNRINDYFTREPDDKIWVKFFTTPFLSLLTIKSIVFHGNLSGSN